MTILCLAGLAAACAVPRPRTPPPAAPPAPEIIEQSPVDQARAWLTEAESIPDPAAARRAIDAVLELDEPVEFLARAERLWSLLPSDGLGVLADRYRGARLALLEHDRTSAMDRLPPVDDPADPALFRDALELHAELLADARHYRQALEARVVLDPMLLDDPDHHAANQRSIWLLLASLHTEQVNFLATVETDLRLRGWAALFTALRTAGTDPGAFDVATRNWSFGYPGHPARAQLPALREATLAPPQEPVRIAVLLPLTGPYGELGRATLEGVLASLDDDPGTRGSLLVFDTEGSPDLAEAHYRNAINQGADRVIGPLTREEVDRVLSTGRAWPALLLNRPSDQVLVPFSVFSLSPEDEAGAVAREAIASGRQRALILVPEGAFGDRVAGAFTETFEQQGGSVTSEHRFQARASDLNAQIGAALGIDGSRDRIAQLSRELRLPLQGDPQVRADIDMIFVAGPARDLRTVAPHLHYHRGGGLPMWATSHVYEGRPQPTLDVDLTGIRFPDAPWLHPELNPDPALKERMGGPADGLTAAHRLPRFAALGIDAGRIAADLPRFRRAPHLEVRGMSGTWRLHPLERIWYREPAWLEFRDGLARPLDSAEPPSGDPAGDPE